MDAGDQPSKRARVKGRDVLELPPAFDHLTYHATLPTTCGPECFLAVLDDGSIVWLEDSIFRMKPGSVAGVLAGSDGTNSCFNAPCGAHLAPEGHLLVADTYNHQVCKVTQAGVVTTLFQIPGMEPTGVTAGVDGTVYVVAGTLFDRTTCVLQWWPGGDARPLAGKADEYGFLDGAGQAALFSDISSPCPCPSGGIFVSDSYWACVRHVSQEGVVTTLRLNPGSRLPCSGRLDLVVVGETASELLIVARGDGRCVRARIEGAGADLTLQAVGESHVHGPIGTFLRQKSGVLYFLCFGEEEGQPFTVYSTALVPPAVSRWRKALRCPSLSDVTFVVGGERFYAGRHALAAHSDYFGSMFTQPMRESELREIIVEDTSPQAFEAMLVYIYSNHVLPLTPMQTLDLAQLADLHTLRDLLKLCCSVIVPSLSLDNATAILMSARRRGLGAIEEGCISFLADNAAMAAEAGALDPLKADPDLAMAVMKRIALRTARGDADSD